MVRQCPQPEFSRWLEFIDRHTVTVMAALRAQIDLPLDRNLHRFIVEATATGRYLGAGSYGTVEEVSLWKN